jgi:signal transduction histidine kinase
VSTTTYLLSVLLLTLPSNDIAIQLENRTQEETISVQQGTTDVNNLEQVPRTIASADSLQALADTERNENPQSAIYAARESLEISEIIGYEQGIATANKILGSIYLLLGDYEIALEYLLTSLELNNQLENQPEIGSVMNMIASLHVLQENYERAIEYYTETRTMMQELGQAETVGSLTMNIGVAHYYMGNYQKALEFYEEAKAIGESEEVEEPRLYMIAITNIGNVQIELGEYDQAEEFLVEAIEYFRENSLNVNLTGAYLYLSKLYHRKGEYERALEQAMNGRDLSVEIDQSQYKLESYQRLAQIYEDMGNDEQAYENFKIFHEEQQKVFNDERSKQINRLQTQYEVEQKNQEIDLLNKEIALREAEVSRQKLWRNFLIGGLVMLALVMILLFRYSSLRKRANKLLNKRKKEIEEQNQQLVRLNEEKNEFLNIAAHDLRGPLSALVGVTELLEHTDESDAASKKEYINIIKDTTNRMLKMINQLLDVNSIESNGSSVNTSLINVIPLAERLVKIYQRQAAEKQISVVSDFKVKTMNIMADESHLRSIIENLLSNAVKFSEHESEVTLQLEKVDDLAKIIVADNGPGISEADQKKLFDRYARLSNKPTGDESSVGLGLYIVKNLTESMNGNIRCESEPGKGSRFIVTFPLIEG